MVRQSPIQGDSQIDWVGFMSDVLAIQLHTDALRSRCIVQMKNAGQCFRDARLKTPIPEKRCNLTKVFVECIFNGREGVVPSAQADIVSIDEFTRMG